MHHIQKLREVIVAGAGTVGEKHRTPKLDTSLMDCSPTFDKQA
jgi:hypothetical protein